MEKPTPRYHHKPCLDYHEAIAYIEGKYKINTRDFLGKFSEKDKVRDVEYLDFWHWILDNTGYNITNGSYFNLSIHDLREGAPEWVQKIMDMLTAEFPLDQYGGIEFYTWW